MPELPPPQPTEIQITPNIAKRIAAAKAPASVRRFGRERESCLARKASKKKRITPRDRPGSARRTWNGVERGTSENGRGTLAPPLVITDTTNGEGLPFVICSVEGP